MNISDLNNKFDQQIAASFIRRLRSRIKKELTDTYDQISTLRNGNLMFRQGFFYKNGLSAEHLAGCVSRNLTQMNIKHGIVNQGEVWKNWKGGGTIAQGSHWYVEVKLYG